jgi:drug/metabolite transporter (DMT)-like permease
VPLSRIKKMELYLVLLIIAICFSVVGELMLKTGINQIGKELSLHPSAIVGELFAVFSHPIILGGFALIFGGSIFWLAVLSRVDLSLAYPMLSMSYVFAGFLSWLVLKEEITWMRMLGIFVICLGVVILGFSRKMP